MEKHDSHAASVQVCMQNNVYVCLFVWKAEEKENLDRPAVGALTKTLTCEFHKTAKVMSTAFLKLRGSMKNRRPYGCPRLFNISPLGYIAIPPNAVYL